MLRHDASISIKNPTIEKLTAREVQEAKSNKAKSIR